MKPQRDKVKSKLTNDVRAIGRRKSFKEKNKVPMKKATIEIIQPIENPVNNAYPHNQPMRNVALRATLCPCLGRYGRE